MSEKQLSILHRSALIPAGINLCAQLHIRGGGCISKMDGVENVEDQYLYLNIEFNVIKGIYEGLSIFHRFESKRVKSTSDTDPLNGHLWIKSILESAFYLPLNTSFPTIPQQFTLEDLIVMNKLICFIKAGIDYTHPLCPQGVNTLSAVLTPEHPEYLEINKLL